MVNVIIIVILLLILSLAGYYIWKERKKGIKCIGCPSAGSCSKCKANEKTTLP